MHSFLICEHKCVVSKKDSMFMNFMRDQYLKLGCHAIDS